MSLHVVRNPDKPPPPHTHTHPPRDHDWQLPLSCRCEMRKANFPTDFLVSITICHFTLALIIDIFLPDGNLPTYWVSIFCHSWIMTMSDNMSVNSFNILFLHWIDWWHYVKYLILAGNYLYVICEQRKGKSRKSRFFEKSCPWYQKRWVPSATQMNHFIAVAVLWKLIWSD